MTAAQEFADLDLRGLASRWQVRLVAHQDALRYRLADEEPPVAVRATVELPAHVSHRRSSSLGWLEKWDGGQVGAIQPCRGWCSPDSAMSSPPRPPARRTSSGTGCSAASPSRAAAPSPWR